MDKLPPELLFKIMLYLPLEDRLSCSLTCRRWAEAISSSQLLNDVWLDIAGHEIKAATSVLVDSQRQYMQLLLYKADLSEVDFAFWENIGANLRVLELERCSWSTFAFYAILQQCPKLESLKLVDDYPRKISMDDFVLPEGACLEELRDSLSHLRHLHLDFKLTAEILDLLLGVMSNVTSIFLSAWVDVSADFLERFPSIVEKNRKFRTGADLMAVSVALPSGDIERFVRRTSESLEDCRICVPEKSLCDEIVNCTALRRLTLESIYNRFDGSHLKKLVSKSPDLETLELGGIGDECMVPLLELKKLRTLSLGALGMNRTATEFLCRLGEVSALVKLDLNFFHVDSQVIRSLVCLTNLRSLNLFGSHPDSECFGAICENFDRLTELDLGYVSNLTDADGMKLFRFKELRSLSFSGGYGLTDLTFERGVGSRSMKSLMIDDCSLTDAGLASIASHHNSLEALHLEHCENISYAGVVALLQSEPRLKELLIEDCPIDAAAVQSDWRTALRNICPRIRDLWTSWSAGNEMD